MKPRRTALELTPAADACLRRCAELLQSIERVDAVIDRDVLRELDRLLKAPTQFLRPGRAIAGVVEISPRARLMELQERLRASARSSSVARWRQLTASRVHPRRPRA